MNASILENFQHFLSIRATAQRTWTAAAILLLSFPRITPAQVSSLTSPLAGLALPHEGRAMHEGSWDRTGGNDDFRPLEPGKTLTLIDHQGGGIIHRFWLTLAPRSEPHIHRQAILRMYWDGDENPAVECPIGDFFGVGFGIQKDYTSLPLNENSGGYNCYWPMPFHKSARWTLTNLSDRKIDCVYWNIDYTAMDNIDPQLRHFHVQWHRENPTTRNRNYTILDTLGEGHFVGTALFVQSKPVGNWRFIEGDEMMYIDGGRSTAPVRKIISAAAGDSTAASTAPRSTAASSKTTRTPASAPTVGTSKTPSPTKNPFS